MVQSVLPRYVVTGSVVLRCTMKPKVSLDSTTVSSVIESVTVLLVWPEVKLTARLLTLVA